MKYFVVEIETMTDGTQAQTITEKASVDEANAQFHAVLGYAMQNPLVQHVCCMSINDEAGIYKAESWTRGED